MKFIPALLTASICLASCTKKDATPAIDFGPNSGITARDANANPQGAPDPTDWTLDGNWNQQEQDLFKDLGLDLNTAAAGSISRIGTYPNPIITQAYFYYETIPALDCSLVIVDANYKVVVPRRDFVPASRSLRVLIDRSANSFQQGKLYRLYYVMRNGSTLYYKGHGDIKIGL